MRYVVLIVMVTVFVTWDVTQNQSRLLHKAGNYVLHLASKIS
jgi:hypothetical protein